MSISFECNVEKIVCEKVEERMRFLLEKAGFRGEAEIRVIVGKPERCVGACVIYNTELDERIAAFNALTSIFVFALGGYLKGKKAACKLWLADGLAALLAARLLENESPGLTRELERRAGSLISEGQLDGRFGMLMLTGPGMVVPSGGKNPEDLAKVATAALEYLNSLAFRVSAAKSVEAKLGQAPSKWDEVLRAAEKLCKMS